MNRDSDT